MPDFSFEIAAGRDAGKIVCGVDEVGRGPLAGPVLAAAAILPGDFPPALAAKITDSKKMTARQREAIFDELTSHCTHAVAEASVAEIAELNILWASMLAMQRAVAALARPPAMALIDGNRCPKLPCPAQAIVKGDGKSLSIAAASIIAKVSRDRFMTKLAQKHPGYGWERNAGYGTTEHIAALQRLGPTPWHRDSFAPVYELIKARG
ncbi:MAG: ribonuclease HII [Alphaproteobacteria bacterium]|nr:ribonuclease HII [Alphaproteobacteria bacterium]